MLVQLKGEKYFLKPEINEKSALGERRPKGECTVTTIRFSICNSLKEGVENTYKYKNYNSKIHSYTFWSKNN